MVQQDKGRPKLCIRLPQEVIDLLMERARQEYPQVRGSSGGASRLVRDWIYEKLEIERPTEWGESELERNRKLRERRRAEQE